MASAHRREAFPKLKCEEMALYPHVMRILILKLPYLDNTRL
jgi:hypothetical protein